MKITITTNTGIQFYPVETLVLDEDAYDVAHLGYNLVLPSGGGMLSGIIAGAAEVLTRMMTDFAGSQGAIMASEIVTPVFALQELVKVIGILARHPGALAYFETERPMIPTP